MERWAIKVLEEVEEWLDALPANHRQKAEAVLGLLAEMGELLPFPHASQLRGSLRELRIQLGGDKKRVTYYAASGRRFVLLTVFRKTKRKETAEIDRAERAMKAHKESEEA